MGRQGRRIDLLLQEYLGECRNRVFEYGVYDCTVFTNNWINIVGWETPPLPAYSTEREAKTEIIKVMRREDVKSLVELVDKWYPRTSYLPPTGCIGARPIDSRWLAFGIVEEAMLISPADVGFKHQRVDLDNDFFWRLF